MDDITDPWNLKDIKPPPVCGVNTKLTPSGVQKVQDLKILVNDAVATISSMKIFRKEASLLTRFLYKYKRAFRQDKGMQNMIKVNLAIRRYRNINLEKILKRFGQCVPNDLTWDTKEAYLPTRQMLKWLLLRILTVAKIMTRILAVSKDAGKYLFGKLRLGWSAHYMIFGLAVTGRIMSCAKYMLLSCSSWYHRLMKYLRFLTETNKFLDSFKFPRRMDELIGPIDLDPPDREDNVERMFDLIDMSIDEDREQNESEDDVVVTNEVFFRTVVANEGTQQEQEVMVEEIRTNYNLSDEEMAIVFERRKVLSPDGRPTTISSTTSITRSAKPRQNRSARKAPVTVYLPSRSRGSRYRVPLSRVPQSQPFLPRTSALRAARSRIRAARPFKSRLYTQRLSSVRIPIPTGSTRQAPSSPEPSPEREYGPGEPRSPDNHHSLITTSKFTARPSTIYINKGRASANSNFTARPSTIYVNRPITVLTNHPKSPRPSTSGEGTSGTSGTSSKPGTSGISSKPGTSGISSMPGTSGISSKPGTSGISSKPGTSGTSSQPGPSGTSATSATSSKPGTSGTSGTSHRCPRAHRPRVNTAVQTDFPEDVGVPVNIFGRGSNGRYFY